MICKTDWTGQQQPDTDWNESERDSSQWSLAEQIAQEWSLFIPCQKEPPTEADPEAPDTPEGLSAQGQSTSSILVGWQLNDEPDMAAYTIYRDGYLIAVVVHPTSSYLDMGLEQATQYSYQVGAVDTQKLESLPAGPETAYTWYSETEPVQGNLSTENDVPVYSETEAQVQTETV